MIKKKEIEKDTKLLIEQKHIGENYRALDGLTLYVARTTEAAKTSSENFNYK